MVVIVPLKPGAQDRVRQLIAQAPPFDSEAAGLERHDVFLTECEAIFLFKASSPSVVEPLSRATALWAAAPALREYVAGPARLAQSAYSWARASTLDSDVSFASTPGPGDSDGGDVFSP